MARIRSTKPEFWTDRFLARRVSRDARMLYMGLWNIADEHARLGGDAAYIKGQLFPYDDDLTAGAIDALLDALDEVGRVVRYVDNGDPYLFLPKLAKHQRLEPDKVPSKLPAPPAEVPAPMPPEPEKEKPQVQASAQIGADSSKSRADESAPDAEPNALLYVTGSMEHGACSREHVPPRADVSQPPLLTLVEAEPLAPLADESATETKKRKRTPKAKTAPHPRFDEFWAAYPLKVSVADAREAFTKAVNNGADPDELIAAAGRYARHCQRTRKDRGYIKQGSGWLNSERWLDDLGPDEDTPPGAELERAGVRPPAARPSTTDIAVASGDTALADFRRLTGRTA